MKPAIEIINLGKAYKLVKSPAYISLREMISGSVQHMMKPGKKEETFMALEDINLNIMPGERVGIIGRNGAGKSTLLKIISRITPPTTGRAVIRGRVGSLLEVGTGFHPELTGRENIFLNGSILGLKKTEIRKQLETIIAFSGVEKFIDTPLKHYSSGMQLRLAFSVAAFLEPEILLIDEVLAVGDAEFQRKCINRMEEVSRQDGRTILFVSHQMNAVSRLCNTAIWLEKGRIAFKGPVEETLSKYQQSCSSGQIAGNMKREYIRENDLFLSAAITNPNISIGDDLELVLNLSQAFPERDLIVNINIRNQYGELISHLLNEDAGFSTGGLKQRDFRIRLKNLNLTPGRYSLSFWAGLDNIHGIDSIDEALSFEITEQNNFTKRAAPYPAQAKTIIQSEWEIL